MKLPRMKKRKYITEIISLDTFNSFKEKFPEYQDMTFETFKQRWEEIASVMREEIITNPLGIKLGSYTGELKYQYLPYKYKARDIATTEQIGKVHNFVNLNTKGKVGVIKWERRWAVKFNKILQFYAFTPFRNLNLMAKKHTDENPNNIRISRITTGGKSVWRQKIK